MTLASVRADYAAAVMLAEESHDFGFVTASSEMGVVDGASLLEQTASTADPDDLACHIVGQIGYQELDHLGAILGHAQPLQRDLLLKASARLRAVAALGYRA
jgi:hypothetical protein